jgi:hypothetical protein
VWLSVSLLARISFMAVIKRHVSLRQRTRINDGARHQPRNWNSTTPFGVGGEELGAEQTDGGEHDGREDGLMAAHGYPMPSSGSSRPAMPLTTSSPALLLSSIRHATTNSSQEAGSAASSQRLLEPSYTLRVANSTITPSISARIYQTTLQYSSATPTSIPQLLSQASILARFRIFIIHPPRRHLYQPQLLFQASTSARFQMKKMGLRSSVLELSSYQLSQRLAQRQKITNRSQ